VGLEAPLNGSVQIHVYIHHVVNYGHREVFKILGIIAAIPGEELYTAFLKESFSGEFLKLGLEDDLPPRREPAGVVRTRSRMWAECIRGMRCRGAQSSPHNL